MFAWFEVDATTADLFHAVARMSSNTLDLVVGGSASVAVRKDRHQDVAPTDLEVWRNCVATKIPLLTELREALAAPRHR